MDPLYDLVEKTLADPAKHLAGLLSHLTTPFS